MNPIEIANSIGTALANRPPQVGKRYQICYEQGRIWCHPLGKPLPPTHIVGIFSDDDLKQGFTNEQWNQIVTQVCKIIESEKGEPKSEQTP